MKLGCKEFLAVWILLLFYVALPSSAEGAWDQGSCIDLRHLGKPLPPIWPRVNRLVDPGYPHGPYRTLLDEESVALEGFIATLKGYQWEVPVFKELPATYTTTSDPLRRFSLLANYLEDFAYTLRLQNEAEPMQMAMKSLERHSSNLLQRIKWQLSFVREIVDAPPEKRFNEWMKHYSPCSGSGGHIPAEDYLKELLGEGCNFENLTYEQRNGYRDPDLLCDALDWREAYMRVQHVFKRFLYNSQNPFNELDLPQDGEGYIYLPRIGIDGRLVTKRVSFRYFVRHLTIHKEDLELDSLLPIENILKEAETNTRALHQRAGQLVRTGPKEQLDSLLRRQKLKLEPLASVLEGELTTMQDERIARLNEIQTNLAMMDVNLSERRRTLAELEKEIKEIQRAFDDGRKQEAEQLTKIERSEAEVVDAHDRILNLYAKPDIPQADTHDILSAQRAQANERRRIQLKITQMNHVLIRNKRALASSRVEIGKSQSDLESKLLARTELLLKLQIMVKTLYALKEGAKNEEGGIQDLNNKLALLKKFTEQTQTVFKPVSRLPSIAVRPIP